MGVDEGSDNIIRPESIIAYFLVVFILASLGLYVVAIVYALYAMNLICDEDDDVEDDILTYETMIGLEYYYLMEEI